MLILLNSLVEARQGQCLPLFVFLGFDSLALGHFPRYELAKSLQISPQMLLGRRLRDCAAASSPHIRFVVCKLQHMLMVCCDYGWPSRQPELSRHRRTACSWCGMLIGLRFKGLNWFNVGLT
jgi:hypothetical protein